MKIYISGAITGIEDSALEIFAKAEKHLQSIGYETVNPMTLNHNHDKTWQSYMREDIKAMCDCSHIYMLKNWIHSKGANIERGIAVNIGLVIMYQ